MFLFFFFFSRLNSGMDLFTLLKNNLSPSKKMVVAISSKDILSVEEVLLSGFPVNSKVQEQGGDTALHLACTKGNYDCSIVKKLIEYKADPSLKNDFGITPLYRAVYSNSVELLKYLLANDSSRSSIDNFWNSLTSMLKGHGNLPDITCIVVMLVATPNFSKYSEYIREKILAFATNLHYHSCEKLMLIFGEKLRTHQGLQNNENDKEKEFNEWIESYKHSVPLLKHCCRMTLRRSLDRKWNVIYGVEQLYLPKSLKQYLKFSDVCPFGL